MFTVTLFTISPKLETVQTGINRGMDTQIVLYKNITEHYLAVRRNEITDMYKNNLPGIMLNYRSWTQKSTDCGILFILRL